MPVEVAVGGKVGNDLERVGGVLERPGRPLAAIRPIAEHGVENRLDITQLLLEGQVRMRKERGCDDLPLRVRIKFHKPDRRCGGRRIAALRQPRGRRPRRGHAHGGRRSVPVVEGAPHEGRYDERKSDTHGSPSAVTAGRTI